MQLQRIQNTLTISGQINLIQLTKPQLDQFNTLFDREVDCLDFSGVTAADSAGVSLILCALRRHKVSLKNLPTSVQLLIDLYELDSFMEAQ